MKKRCIWAGNDPLYIKYHDHEWGVPVIDDKLLFEFLILEGQQAGLSWIIVLKKRLNYRISLDDFDPNKISGYDDEKINQLLANPGIIRNRLKIYAIVQNAQSFLRIQQEFGSFSNYVWNFVDQKPIVNRWKSLKETPSKTKISDAISKDLKKRNFGFVGSTIIYAYMQAVGMINDHTTDCFRYQEIIDSY
jgi:DNA-3-methyladenine glycosylase I